MSNSSHQIPDKAESISVTPSGNLTSTDVQNALQELQTDIDGLGGGSGGWELVSTTDLSVTTFPASIEYLSLSSNYQYMFILEGLANGGAGNTLGMQVSTDNGSTWRTNGTDYYNTLECITTAGSSVPEGGQSSSMKLSGSDNNGSSSSLSVHGTFKLSGLNSNTNKLRLEMSGFIPLSRSIVGSSWFQPGLAVDAIRILPSAGSLGNEGKVHFYRLSLV